MSSQVLVQICSYNGNMQGDAIAQDLVDWLAPTLTTSSFLANRSPAPDILVVGFQELLPLHLGFAGMSRSLLRSRDVLIRETIEKHAKAPYVLVGKVVNVGVAMLVYAKDEENSLASRIRDVETTFTSCGPLWLGNKGAVGLRFRLLDEDDTSTPGEIFTFVNAHLTAHSQRYSARLRDYRHIVQTLLFNPVRPGSSAATIYDTTHLFFSGDLNFRIAKEGHDASTKSGLLTADILTQNASLAGRRELKQHDQLTRAKAHGKAFIGLREGEVEQFPLTFKYVIGSVHDYSSKRTPSWTDRILYTTASDNNIDPSQSNITNILYTSILAFTKSDHKPITALLLLPSPKVTSIAASNSASDVLESTASQLKPTPLPPLITLPPHELDLCARPTLRRIGHFVGKPLDWIVGWVWYFLWFIGAGRSGLGIGNFVLGVTGFVLWRNRG